MAKANKWTAEDIPDRTGKVALVTSGNCGLGYETVQELAIKGAHEILACRDSAKGDAARAQVCRPSSNASIEVIALDLASLASIRQFAESVKVKHDQLTSWPTTRGSWPPHVAPPPRGLSFSNEVVVRR